MTYKINEIFQSLQGEGYHSGMPAIFIRFSGCNLNCSFCDTQHKSGKNLTTAEILKKVTSYAAPLIVLTGGEPSLYIDEDLIKVLRQTGKTIAIETNGTRPLPEGIDWITLSPKDDFQDGAKPVLAICDELKVVYTGTPLFNTYPEITARYRFLQPCDTNNNTENMRLCQEAVRWCMEHPQWRLSLQIHKIIGIR